MFRIIFFITLILIAIPLFNKGAEYWKGKMREAKTIARVAEKMIQQGSSDEK